jgi:acetyl-CoA C-acetyltransferase
VKDIFIIDGLRTPIGKRRGSLKDISAVKLAAIIIKALLDNNKLKGDCIDEVILGNAVGAGLGQNPARQALLHARLPFKVPAFTVNKVCGSGLKSVILGAQAIACGDADIILAGGAENVSQCPQNSLINDGLWCSFTDAHMGTIAEWTAERFKISREAQDDYALQSHKKACAAQSAGLFRREVVPVEVDTGRVFDADERPRAISIDELSRVSPAFKPGGSVTAGNSPSPADGAAVLILASERALKKCGITPIARILGYASAAVDPQLTFTAPAVAIKKCLRASSIGMPDVDLFEINEAFAVQALLTIEELGLDTKRLNIFGGTIALGHPLGASGARGLVTLLNALKTEKKKIGMTNVCLGGGCSVSLAIRML